MDTPTRYPLALVVVCFTVLVVLVALGQDKPTAAPSPTPTTIKAKVVKATPKPTKKKVSRSKPRTGYRYTVQLNTPSKRYAHGLVSATQWPCLHELWMRESGWSPTSDNPTSSAYGIPQILGLEARTGDDARAQVRAGLSYINHRYGTPCRAWSFWTTHRWY